MPGKLDGSKAFANNTITSTQLTTALSDTIVAGGGPKIKTIIYPGANTSAKSNGGQTIYLTGSGFYANSNVYVNNAAVPAMSYISASNLQFTTPALPAANYAVYVINTDGGFAVKVPGLSVTVY